MSATSSAAQRPRFRTGRAGVSAKPMIIPPPTGPTPASAAIVSGCRAISPRSAVAIAVMIAAGAIIPATETITPRRPAIRRPRSPASATKWIARAELRQGPGLGELAQRDPPQPLDEDAPDHEERARAAADDCVPMSNHARASARDERRGLHNRHATDELVFKPLTPSRIDDFAHVLRSSGSGSACWDLWPRVSAAEQRADGLDRSTDKRRAKLAALARRRHAPGLLAYRGREAVGWVSVGPRLDYHRLANSKATPAVDDAPAWVIPCLTVRREARGQGVATALVRAAVAYATSRGAPAVEAYPRAGGKRVHDEWAFYGTEALFRKAGFRKVRGVLPMPKGWTPRVTMRAASTIPRT
jgi:GNAT superfamily N-acetyltransferase